MSQPPEPGDQVVVTVPRASYPPAGTVCRVLRPWDPPDHVVARCAAVGRSPRPAMVVAWDRWNDGRPLELAVLIDDVAPAAGEESAA